MKKPLVVILAVVFCASLYGCNTVKCACKGAKEGAKKDWNATQVDVSGANGWIKKNLW